VAYTGFATNTAVFRINGKAGALQYLNASREYLEDPSLYSRMNYPFPKVSERCLLCQAQGCSRWKGYYVRQVICIWMGYAGPVAIHLAQCRRRGVDYTYWPGILVPYLWPTIPSLKLFYLTWMREHSIRAAIDEVVGRVEQDLTLCFSTAYRWLAYVVRALILNYRSLHIRAPESAAATELRSYGVSEISPVFEGEKPWSPVQHITLVPP
jgi:hypothetical protein